MNMHCGNVLMTIYRKLFRFYGPQEWWPGETPFEIAVGAILTQNTNWGNVERAIRNLKERNLLSPDRMWRLSHEQLSRFVKPAGYFNVKARRLRSFLDFLMREYGGSMDEMAREHMETLRARLLHVHGIGPETADSILLYALGKPVFVIDAYTRRILSRHCIMGEDRSYAEFQQLFHANVKRDVRLYNEYHALLVRLGKTLCRPRIPQCDACPLSDRR